MSIRIPALALAAAAFAAPALAVNVTLDFAGNICDAAGNGACSNYDQFGQNYGDVAGVLDVSHRSFVAATLVTYEPYLKYWSTAYSNLVDVAWGGANASGYGSEFTFMPGSGQMVTLNSMDFGDYQNRSNTSSVKVYDGTGTVLLWNGGSFDPGATALSFSPNISSANGLVLRWGPDGYDVGIDNISLSVTAVPEPGTWALLLAGVAALGVRSRRRRG